MEITAWYSFRYEQAIDAYLRALEQNPNSVELIFNYVVCCVVLMRLDEAFEGLLKFANYNLTTVQRWFLKVPCV